MLWRIMPAGGKRIGAGRPKGSRALTLLASTGERMGFYEAVRQYDQEALRLIASVMRLIRTTDQG
jgi:hypothetical protein